MKKHIIIIVSIVILLMLLGVMLAYSIKENSKRITSIKTMHLSYSNGYGMYENTRYDLVKRADGYYVTIKPSGIPDEEEQEAKVLDEDIDRIVKILNDNKVIKWDGFHESDKYVLDGDSFSFSLTTYEGISISASGYMRWPDNYRNVRGTLVEIFDAYYKYDVKVYE